uniref:Uncharacterized protein n=1 Tax=Ciona savignyi TaxID=51511 RepID=H2Y544_CIOSA
MESRISLLSQYFFFTKPSFEPMMGSSQGPFFV